MPPQDAPPLWITEADVVSMMDMEGAIRALEAGLLFEARGAAHNMVKTHTEWGGGHTLHAIGAVFAEAGFVGTKTWAHTEGGATPLLLLFDSHDGSLRAVIEAFALGQMRTGGISGVATRWLASPEAREMAVIGTGKQAITQVAAVLAVRPIQRVRVFGRDADKRARFSARVQQELGIETQQCSSVAEAVQDVPVITVVTRATEPIVSASMVAKGAHINAMGAIVPSRAEIAADVMKRSTCVVADSVPQAQKLSREMMEFYGPPGSSAWEQVWPISRLLAEGRRRLPSDDITLFKSLGMGISDLALGIELYRRALKSGIGRPLEQPQKVKPRLRRMEQGTSA